MEDKAMNRYEIVGPRWKGAGGVPGATPVRLELEDDESAVNLMVWHKGKWYYVAYIDGSGVLQVVGGLPEDVPLTLREDRIFVVAE
jgi:hypothetical protein